MIDGAWLAVQRTDPRAYALYRRHYSAEKNSKQRRSGNTNIVGPAEHMVLMTQCCRALFVWIRNTVERLDHQEGVNCAVFRNEGAGLSSDLIREADELAWQRWQNTPRHFTYVDPGKVRKKRDPGQCFLKAGWRTCGYSARGLLILEKLA